MVSIACVLANVLRQTLSVRPQMVVYAAKDLPGRIVIYPKLSNVYKKQKSIVS